MIDWINDLRDVVLLLCVSGFLVVLFVGSVLLFNAAPVNQDIDEARRRLP